MKKFNVVLIVCSVLFVIGLQPLFGRHTLRFMRTGASPSPAPSASLSLKAGESETFIYPVDYSRPYLKATYIGTPVSVPGEGNVLTAIFTNVSSNSSPVLVDLELYSSDNRKIAQKFWDNVVVWPEHTATFQLATPENLAAGSYYYSVGIFNPGWNGNLKWYSVVQRFSVTGDETAGDVQGTETASLSASQQTPLPAPPPADSSRYTARRGVIYRNGNPIQLRGVSWFGFENPNHVVHGLWARNWKDMVQQMKGLGFNAVRLPFCPATLRNTQVGSVNYILNPDLHSLNSLQVLDKVMEEFNRSGMHILLDHHTPDCLTISDLWYEGGYNEDQWVNDLRFLADRYKHLEYFMGIDIKNEPKGSATWGTGNHGTDWNLAAERAGKSVLSANPQILIFVQGIQESRNCSGTIGHWWGGNLEPQACNPINPAMIPAEKLVLSPHVYGPDVYSQPYFNESSFPGNMPHIWETHFGYLTKKGYTVVPGEWGGKYGTNGGNPKDVTWQQAIVHYFKSNRICNSFYWSWNPNSGDTGGILQDDWRAPWHSKLNLLNDYYYNCNYTQQN